MRVDTSQSNQAAAAETQKTKGAKKAQSPDKADAAKSVSANASAATKTEVSDKAREMAFARTAAQDAPETREEKIAALKARIAAGKYEVDNKAVADKLVDDHVRMSGIG